MHLVVCCNWHRIIQRGILSTHQLHNVFTSDVQDAKNLCKTAFPVRNLFVLGRILSAFWKPIWWKTRIFFQSRLKVADVLYFNLVFCFSFQSPPWIEVHGAESFMLRLLVYLRSMFLSDCDMPSYDFLRIYCGLVVSGGYIVRTNCWYPTFQRRASSGFHLPQEFLFNTLSLEMITVLFYILKRYPCEGYAKVQFNLGVFFYFVGHFV
mgnify:CR=1 FL=1